MNHWFFENVYLPIWLGWLSGVTLIITWRLFQ